MSDVPTPNLDIDTVLGHTLTFSEGGVLEIDGVPVAAGTASTVTAAGTTTVTVSQTGTGAIEITPNATGGLTIEGATTTPITVGASTNHLGFFGATPVAQQDASAVTTVAELIVLLNNLGLTHS